MDKVQEHESFFCADFFCLPCCTFPRFGLNHNVSNDSIIGYFITDKSHLDGFCKFIRLLNFEWTERDTYFVLLTWLSLSRTVKDGNEIAWRYPRSKNYFDDCLLYCYEQQVSFLVFSHTLWLVSFLFILYFYFHFHFQFSFG